MHFKPEKCEAIHIIMKKRRVYMPYHINNKAMSTSKNVKYLRITIRDNLSTSTPSAEKPATSSAAKPATPSAEKPATPQHFLGATCHHALGTSRQHLCASMDSVFVKRVRPPLPRPTYRK